MSARKPDTSSLDWKAYGIYILVALAVMLPLLKPGFILTLDMVFTPKLRMPADVTASYPLHALLHILNVVLPAGIITKLLLMAALLLASTGMHRLIRILQRTPPADDYGIYIASVFFAINPFTYSRYMAGQYAVLLGYALLPWFVRLLLIYGRQPGVRNAIKIGGLAAVIGAVSIHTLGELGIILAAAAAIALWQYRQNLRAYIRYSALAAVSCLVLSSYWLIPLAAGHSKTAATVHSFTSADTQAFATTGGSVAGKLGNVLRLQGFWAEGRHLYILPQAGTILWGLMALIVIGLVIAGAVKLHRERPAAALLVGLSGVVAIILALGFASGAMNAIGYREPHKFIGLLVLAYATFLAFGIPAMLAKLQQKGTAAYAAGMVMVFAVPLLLTRVMFWGFAGQLAPRQYPASWFAINNTLNQDKGNFSVLSLPWHQYMSFRFAGRLIADPSASFFDHDTIVSQDPELAGASGGQQDGRHRTIGQLLQNSKSSEDFSRQLARNNVKYILLAKEVDYSQYNFLQQHNDLQLVADYPDIALYKNNAWRTH
ncbi:MAG TPA: hypothetical protein VGO07_04780 [Candidatus Saccharimonadales bacterium]|jgi:hypothetical protein|nr:hypothetical protein [Candidatus Saccharimonadales bacterium]